MKTKLVMLETSQYSDIQIKLDGKLHLEDGSSIALKSYAQFYLIDTDAEIKERKTGFIIDCRDNMNGFIHEVSEIYPNTYLIIASTDKSLVIEDKNNPYDSRSKTGVEPYCMPQLSEQSIKLAIDYFNRSGKREVEVEVEEIHEKIAIYNFAMGLDEEVISKIKFNPEGKVDITLPQEKITITLPTDIAETLVAVIDSRIGTSDDDEFNRQMHIVLKEIDKKITPMKTKLVRPILVESKEPTDLFIGETYGVLHYKNTTPEEQFKIYQQLILISLEDEKIEVGDKFYDEESETIETSLGIMNGLILVKENSNVGCNPDFCSKVIATQSQLSHEYVQQFIEEYNKGEVKDISIEMEEYADGNGMYRNGKMFQPKLTNGFVTIVEKLQMPKISVDDLPLTNGNYTEEEVIELLEKAFIKAASYAGFVSYYELMPKKYAKEWFEQNKKK